MTELGAEAARLDAQFATGLSVEARRNIWASVASILDFGPAGSRPDLDTGLALGFVQSGKTTSITALMAAGADAGYRVIVAFLGSTNLLLDQNQSRIDRAIGISDRSDYRWVMEPSPSGNRKSQVIADRLDLGRTVFIPVLKHAGRIDKLADVLSRVDLSDVPVLIVDDEADQASLNVASDSKLMSRTYEAITNLRQVTPKSLYVQYTATPYAPLLLDPSDHLLPQFVEFLQPGEGYTGGKEFFVDHADQVVRNVPSLEEQSTRAPIELPRTLLAALANFFAGTAMLLHVDPEAAPVSMLVHSTHRNDIQSRYHHLLERQIRDWREAVANASDVSALPAVLLAERQLLRDAGATDTDDETFLERLRFVVRETVTWLVNSTEAVNKVNWNVSPVHILVGGNKLDRGFTVEGLTVTYMNRKPSNQVDTLEQRARAFGYRGDLLPYCQFFASKRTVQVLRDVVFTEYDLRTRLQDHLEEGGSVETWGREVGLLLPPGTKPTRANVVTELSNFPAGWRSLRTPSLASADISANSALVTDLGLLAAPPRHYGRRAFRTLEISLDGLKQFVTTWRGPALGSDWRLEQVLEVISRHPHREQPVRVVLMEEPEGQPRTRKWDPNTGFVNLFQGRDNAGPSGTLGYAGDRSVPDIETTPDQIALQVHRVQRRDFSDPDNFFTLAVYLGERQVIRTTDSDTA